jgi:hypothetical protein
LGDFHEYFNEKKLAPYLTVFIGGNHEDMHFLSSLYQLNSYLLGQMEDGFAIIYIISVIQEFLTFVV